MSARRTAPDRVLTAPAPESPLQAGLVVAAHGRHLIVEAQSGQRVQCHLRGKKNEAVVGDHVAWRTTGDGGVVEALEPRRNLLFRQDEWRTKQFAANLDQVLVLLAAEPNFSEAQLARALVAAAAAGIPAWIGLNKSDLAAIAAARERLAPYRAMGVEVLELALKAQPQESLAALQPRLAGRVTLVLGPSGMGKSTLINLLVPDAAAVVGEVSRALQSGRHTTTTSTWYWLDGPQRGALIDSPGFQEFGLRHLQAASLVQWMPDLAAEAQACRFHNCSHRHEPGCGVLEALAQGRISASRWRLYDQLMGELTMPRW